jgi:AraC family transcriptional regulator
LRYSPESLECAGALKNDLLKSSVSLGWTSCVLDHVEGDGETDVHETHITPDLTIVLATQGEHDVEVFRNGRWRQAIYQVGATGMTPGEAGTRLRWRNRKMGSPFRTAHLYVPSSLLTEAAELCRRPGQPLSADLHPVLVCHDRSVGGVIEALLECMAQGAPDIFAETGLRWLAMNLLTRFREGFGSNDDRRRCEALTDRRLARAIEYMTSNLAQPVSVDGIAKEAGISPFHFARLFRRSTGQSPHAYLTQLRLEKAHSLLQTTDLSVSVIGAECGYALPSSFSSAFFRHFGISPMQLSRAAHHG